MKTFTNRLDDICVAEEHGWYRHFERAAEVLAGVGAGAWLSGGIEWLPGVLTLVVAAVLYGASMAIKQAHGDSIVAFRRDFSAVMEDLELTEPDDENAAGGWIFSEPEDSGPQ